MGVKFSPKEIRLAIIQFNTKFRIELTFAESDLSNSDNYDILVQKIERIHRLNGKTTNTAKALREANKYFERNNR